VALTNDGWTRILVRVSHFLRVSTKWDGGGGLTMSAGVDSASLVGSWAHSHEEDHDGAQVFRRSDFEFPPSRGREAFTLRPDGSAVAGLPGPDDRGTSTGDGTWHLQGDVLRVSCPGWEATYQVVSVATQGLQLRPVR
jgi:hypothetical protein